MDSHVSYIVPENYASNHKAEFADSLPEDVKITGFWTPSANSVVVAERTFRELIHRGATDLSVIYPDLAKNPTDFPPDSARDMQGELVLIGKNYNAYTRQFVGMVIDGHKVIFCNYTDFQKIDPSTDYIFIQKVFGQVGGFHFLQCRYDFASRSCQNVAIIGSWQEVK